MMFKFGLGYRVVVALDAERLAGAHEEFFVRGFMRIMAGLAFAVLGRLMFDLEFRDRILVALKADLAQRRFHGHGVTRLVTGIALVIGVGRMNRVGIDLNDRIIDGCNDYVVGLQTCNRPIGCCARARDSVKEKAENFVLGFGTAPCSQQQPATGDYEKRYSGQAAVWWPVAFVSRWVHSV